MDPSCGLDEPINSEAFHKMAGQVDRLATELLGSTDADKEKPTGRIPMLEARVNSADKRIGRIERLILITTGVLMVLGFAIEHVVKG